MKEELSVGFEDEHSAVCLFGLWQKVGAQNRLEVYAQADVGVHSVVPPFCVLLLAALCLRYAKANGELLVAMNSARIAAKRRGRTDVPFGSRLLILFFIVKIMF